MNSLYPTTVVDPLFSLPIPPVFSFDLPPPLVAAVADSQKAQESRAKRSSSASGIGKRKYTKWSKDDVQKLVTFLRDNPPDWHKLAELLSFNYTPEQCRYKYLSLRKGVEGQPLQRWTHVQNQTLLKFYEIFPDNWPLIASAMRDKFAPEDCQRHFNMLQYIVPENTSSQIS